MSVTTSERFDPGEFTNQIGGRGFEWTGERLDFSGAKTITGLGGVTDQEIEAAIPAAVIFLSKRESSQATARSNVKQAYPTLRQWAQDAAATTTNWPTMTAGQKDAAMRETIRRLGILLDHVGDLVVAASEDGDQG